MKRTLREMTHSVRSTPLTTISTATQGAASLALVYVLIGLSARLGRRFAYINVESPACAARH